MMNLCQPLRWVVRAGTGVVSMSLLCGCVHDYWNYRAVPEMPVAVANSVGSEGPVMLKVEPASPAAALPKPKQLWLQEHAPSVATQQTVLVVTYQHDASLYGTSVGRTLVLMLDGPLKLDKQYWMTPDNAVLVSYSAYSAPTRERVGLEGSIKILKIDGRQITADIACRDVTDIDETEFVDQPWDPLYRQFPFFISGRRTFAVTTPSDPLFEKTGVKWVR
jgi:hypothetical protein